MPSPPAVPNVLVLAFGWTVSEDTTAQVKLHIAWSGSIPTSAALTSIASDMHGDMATLAEPLMSSDTLLESVIVTDMTSDTGASGDFVGPDAGTRSGTPLPAEACLIMNHRIARRYRGGKPRSYFPWGVAGDLADRQTWNAGFLDAVETGWATFLTNVAARPSYGGVVLGSFVNVGLYKGFTPVTNPLTGRTRDVPKYIGMPNVDTIVLSQPNPKVGSQRRRQLHSA
jgi:hypothetical protein